MDHAAYLRSVLRGKWKTKDRTFAGREHEWRLMTQVSKYSAPDKGWTPLSGAKCLGIESCAVLLADTLDHRSRLRRKVRYFGIMAERKHSEVRSQTKYG